MVVLPSIHPFFPQPFTLTEYLVCAWYLERVGYVEVAEEDRVLPSNADTREVRKPGPLLQSRWRREGGATNHFGGQCSRIWSWIGWGGRRQVKEEVRLPLIPALDNCGDPVGGRAPNSQPRERQGACRADSGVRRACQHQAPFQPSCLLFPLVQILELLPVPG